MTEDEELEKAVAECTEALKRTTGKDRAAIFEKMGDAYREHSIFSKAIFYYKEALTAGKEDIELCVNYVSSLDHAGDFDGVVRFVDDIMPKMDDPLAIARLKTCLAYAQWRAGLYEDAKRSAENALRIMNGPGSKSPGVLRAKGHCLNALGLCQWELGQPREAQTSYRDAASAFLRTRYMTGAAWTKNNIGLIHVTFGEFDEALKIFNEALVMAIEHGPRQLEATTIGNIGLVHMYRGDLDVAEEHYRKTMKICESLRYHYGLHLGEVNLADLLMERGEPAQARRWCERASAGFKEMGEVTRVAWARLILAKVVLASGDVEEAERLADEALGIARERRSLDTEGMALRVRGLVSAAKGDLAGAEQFMKEGIAVYKKMEAEHEVGRGSRELAAVLKAKGAMEEARRLAKEARRLLTKASAVLELKRLDALGL